MEYLKRSRLSKLWRRTYLLQNIFEFFLAAASVLTAITYVINPEALATSSVGIVAPPFDWAWVALFAFGGSAVVRGLWTYNVRTEMFGLVLLATGAVIQSLTVLIVYGGSGVSVFYRGIAFALASYARFWYVKRVASLNARFEG